MEAGEEMLVTATTLHPMVCPETHVKYAQGVITVAKPSKHVDRWLEAGVLVKVKADEAPAKGELVQKTGHGEDGTDEVKDPEGDDA